jgi:hypothetical protein
MMWSKLGLVGCAVLGAAVAACGGSDGAKGDPGPQGPAGPAGSSAVGTESVSAVTPARAFLARTVDVEISGFGTNWTSAPTVDFGAGITVKNVSVASPTGLVATIEVSKTATLGAHDVTVTANGNTDTFKGAFKVDSPLEATLQGTVAQGSIVVGHLKNLDIATPFDLTSTGDGLFTPITYTNLNFGMLSGANISISSATAPTIYGVDFLLLTDVTAPTTAQTLDLASGPMGGTDDDFVLPSAFTLTARTGTPLTSGTPATGNIAKPYDSVLYTFAPAAASATIVQIAASATDPNASPVLALLPKSGLFADLIAVAPTHSFATLSTDPFYAIYWDQTGTTGAFTVTTQTTAATAVAMAAGATTLANAQATGALPVVITGGTLTSATDQHWFKFTAAAGDVNKVVHVVTYPGDPLTDTIVDVQDSSGTSLGGPSADSTYHEDFTSSAIPKAGDYYVQIAASPYFNPAHGTFGAWIKLE